jgi:hypothetical protein
MTGLYDLVVNAFYDDVDSEAKAFAIFGFTKMHVNVDDGVASSASSAHSASHELDGAEEASYICG